MFKTPKANSAEYGKLMDWDHAAWTKTCYTLKTTTDKGNRYTTEFGLLISSPHCNNLLMSTLNTYF